MALFKVCRGKETNLPSTLTNGYAYFCTDTTNFYIDHLNASNTLVRSKISANYADKLRYVKDGSTIEIDPSTILTDSNYETKIGTVTTSKNGLMSKADKIKLDGIAEGANKYVLPVATSTALGGIVAETATDDDTQAVRIGADNKLVTAENVLRITLTESMDDGVMVFIADKTFAEIRAACESNKYIYAVFSFDGAFITLPLVTYSDRILYFAKYIYGYQGPHYNMLTLICETYNSYDRWHFSDISQDIISPITPKNKSNDKDSPSVKAVVDYFKFLQIDDDGNLTNIRIKDQINGYNYILCMRNGTLATTCAITSINITTNPTKMAYTAGDYIDTTGMVVSAACEDGTIREITEYTCDNYVTLDNPVFTITYTEGGVTYSTTLTVAVTAFDAAVVLVDFTYTDNGDGTYTITDWKETYNGEASTEMIVPNNGCIIL